MIIIIGEAGAVGLEVNSNEGWARFGLRLGFRVSNRCLFCHFVLSIG